MKKIKTILIFLAFLLVIGLGIVLSPHKDDSDKTNAGNNKLKVAATIFPLYDIARNVIGERGNVVLILPPGASPHTFDVTPKQIKDLQGAQGVFAIGGLDQWVNSLAESVPGAELYIVNNEIELKKNMDEDEADLLFDPHYWLSVRNAQVIAFNILGVVSQIDPENKTYYEERTRAYVAELQRLDSEIRNDLSLLQSRSIISFHDSWRYFADAYGLDVVGVFEPTPGQEPSPKYLQELFQTAKEHNISAVFSEPQLPSDLLKPFIQDLGLRLYVIDPIGGVETRETYIDLMRYNTSIIKQALSQY